MPCATHKQVRAAIRTVVGNSRSNLRPRQLTPHFRNAGIRKTIVDERLEPDVPLNYMVQLKTATHFVVFVNTGSKLSAMCTPPPPPTHWRITPMLPSSPADSKKERSCPASTSTGHGKCVAQHAGGQQENRTRGNIRGGGGGGVRSGGERAGRDVLYDSTSLF